VRTTSNAAPSGTGERLAAKRHQAQHGRGGSAREDTRGAGLLERAGGHRTQGDRPAREVESLAAFLCKHVYWMAAHPAAADYAEKIWGAVGAARRVARPGSVIRTELEPCAALGCESAVYAVTRCDGPGPEVSCDSGHVLQPHQWLLLENRQSSDDVA
jgi:hypothetical protein